MDEPRHCEELLSAKSITNDEAIPRLHQITLDNRGASTRALRRWGLLRSTVQAQRFISQ